MDYENVLLVKNEVFLYMIPPRQSNLGHKASDWKLDSPTWTGRLRVVAKGKNLTLRLEDRNTGDLFAECPVDAFPGIAVEPVRDSSRYFVTRLVNRDDGRVMFTGLGFSERSDSFDLNVAIQDHFKWLKQEKDAEEAQLNSTNQPSLNLGFKQGERIKLNLNTRRSGDEPGLKAKPSLKIGNVGASGGLLPPPPPPANSRSRGGRGAIDDMTVHSADLVDQTTAKEFTQDLSDPKSTVQTTPSNVDLLADLLGPSGGPF